MSDFERFFGQLTWAVLERRIVEAIQRPEKSVPLEVNCPAVFDLARMIMSDIGRSAIQTPGQAVSEREFFDHSQKVGVMRILEAIIFEFEEWRRRQVRIESERRVLQGQIEDSQRNFHV